MSRDRTAEKYRWSGFEGTAPEFRDRVTKGDGTLLVQADIASIAYQIHRVTSAGIWIATPETGTLTVASVIFDTAQYDTHWGTSAETNAKGFNFKTRFSAANLVSVSEAITYYEIHIRATETGGQKHWIAPNFLAISPMYMNTEA